MVIESYGYKFLRINRFNLGEDPVSTLSERLKRLVGDVATGSAMTTGASKPPFRYQFVLSSLIVGVTNENS